MLIFNLDENDTNYFCSYKFFKTEIMGYVAALVKDRYEDLRTARQKRVLAAHQHLNDCDKCTQGLTLFK